MSAPPSPDPRGPGPSASAEASAFARLAPFIQTFIWRRGWAELRAIQTQAIHAVLDTTQHLLLAAGTASGKTEAAMLPILTQIYEQPPHGVGVLYIGPLKALINDQFGRLTELCEDAELPVTAWHGDIGQHRKERLLREPAGILQITPESLEGLLLNRAGDLQRIFGDLRWVVIDEVHAFMGSDRGGQVLALLDRLARFARRPEQLPRRAGLSATVGDYAAAKAWLAGTTGREVTVVEHAVPRTVYLLVEHFWEGADDEEAEHDEPVDGRAPPESRTDLAERLIARAPDLYEAAYGTTLDKKSLVFTNARHDAEAMIAALRHLAERRGTPDIYHVHHGSISAELREAAEVAMRELRGPQCTAATVTLELGIDLGDLDRILQRGPTWSVSSFLQRLGRAGRRGQRPEMFFLIAEQPPEAGASVLDRVPWDLLRAIAVIQLYAEDRWIEPVHRPHLPGSLLYQQTMSVLAAAGELNPAQLAEHVLTLSPFREVSQEQYRTFLHHLLAIDHLERTDTGTLILGLAGEKVVRTYRFLATFQDPIEWTVKEGSRSVGSLGGPVPVGERITLAGHTWVVTDLVTESRLILVTRLKGSVRTRFDGRGMGDVHDRIVERMRRALLEEADYPYLGDRARERLAEARALAHSTGIAEGPRVVPLGGHAYAVLPWAGTVVLRTLVAALTAAPGIRNAYADGLVLRCAIMSDRGADALTVLQQTVSERWEGARITAGLSPYQLRRAKYDEFLPESLLREAFAADALDPDRAQMLLKQALSALPPSPSLTAPT